MTQRQVLVALGSNLAHGASRPAETLEAALSLIKRADFRLSVRSPLYLTPALPAGSGPDFVNAVAVFVSDLLPRDILGRLHDAEDELGRERLDRWGARTIDLDLLAVDELVQPDHAEQRRWMALAPALQEEMAPGEVVLPHPRLQDRAFVLVPLCDVAPEWRHPVLDRTAVELRDALGAGEIAAIRRNPE